MLSEKSGLGMCIECFSSRGVDMNLLSWLKGLFSSRTRSLAGYRSGMAKAKAGDFAGAVEAYTQTIEASGIPPDVVGMATYNRALAYSALKEFEKADADLKKVLAMKGLPDNIKLAASQRQERIRRREG
jgi:tetratricopeptide (TPR) repeat protein